MEYAVGAVLALSIGLFATLAGFDRDRAFYPAVVVTIASYYALFAIMGAGIGALAVETAVFVAFAGISVIGFRTNLWIVAGALAAHGLFDVAHGHLVPNPGVPGWWPVFCLSFDVVAAGYLGWRLKSGRLDAQARPASTSRAPSDDRAPSQSSFSARLLNSSGTDRDAPSAEEA
jgi:hypothetical protein